VSALSEQMERVVLALMAQGETNPVAAAQMALEAMNAEIDHLLHVQRIPLAAIGDIAEMAALRVLARIAPADAASLN
jgi:hypothetical protein